MTQVPGEQPSLREPARCREEIRAQFGGYERCHRTTGHEQQPHHARGRSWSGSWSAGTARIQFGVGCDEGCVFADEVSMWGAPSGIPGGASRIAPWRHRRRR
jgi:hypothetical protein